MHEDAASLIEQLDLERHPEGGFFRRMYESETYCQTDDNKNRRLGSAIYYLLPSDDYSAWHKLQSDELWFHHKGSPITVYMINKRGLIETYLLGEANSSTEAQFQLCVPANTWFAAEVAHKDSYALLSCAVMPGFEFEDFEMAERNKLLNDYPEHADLIKKLSR